MDTYLPHRDLSHRDFRDDDFWRDIPAWANVTREEFADFRWQLKNSVRKIDQIAAGLGDRLPSKTLKDFRDAFRKAPMNIRISPYAFSLINWDNVAEDPLRKQFIPMASQFVSDHPFSMDDSLAEDTDSPVPYLTHRYPDKVLFLPITVCPVYCSYCTRSRLVGGASEAYEKASYGANATNFEPVFDYLVARPEIEDVVISGGDAFMLKPKQVRQIGERLLAIPNIRRIRYATKGISVLPQKILNDNEWFDAICQIHELGKSQGKQVMIHTHFSSANEITNWTKKAMEKLFAQGITIRNQAVLQRGVNDTVELMIQLVKKLSYINIEPYYVYIHDMVRGCEHLRTTLRAAVELEKAVRGITAGFNTPTFVCDLPNGGGKRHVASYEYYDEENGISVWRAPSVKPGQVFTYFDPIHELSLEAQRRWANERTSKMMVQNAKEKLGSNHCILKQVAELR
jgi:lysine 2,3-aminomutase